jgi:hypothetical protein
MSEDEPICELKNDGEELFVLVNGMKIAKRNASSTWIMLEPGWIVRDVERKNGKAIEVRYEGATIH